MRIQQRAAACASQGLDLARSKTWMKDCPRHTSDSTVDEARAGRGGLPGGHAERGLMAIMVFLDHGIMGQNVEA